jgi:hypothetical protein
MQLADSSTVYVQYQTAATCNCERRQQTVGSDSALLHYKVR